MLDHLNTTKQAIFTLILWGQRFQSLCVYLRLKVERMSPWVRRRTWSHQVHGPCTADSPSPPYPRTTLSQLERISFPSENTRHTRIQTRGFITFCEWKIQQPDKYQGRLQPGPQHCRQGPASIFHSALPSVMSPHPEGTPTVLLKCWRCLPAACVLPAPEEKSITSAFPVGIPPRGPFSVTRTLQSHGDRPKGCIHRCGLGHVRQTWKVRKEMCFLRSTCFTKLGLWLRGEDEGHSGNNTKSQTPLKKPSLSYPIYTAALLSWWHQKRSFHLKRAQTTNRAKDTPASNSKYLGSLASDWKSYHFNVSKITKNIILHRHPGDTKSCPTVAPLHLIFKHNFYLAKRKHLNHLDQWNQCLHRTMKANALCCSE